MATIIKVDIVSDIMCPWCIIGYKRLACAVSELGMQDRVELEWQPFELNPEMPPEGEFLPAYFARKYGMTAEEGLRSRATIATLGAELGFRFDFFDGMKKVNTRDAHILLDYAKEFGKQTELTLRLFEAYFTERKDISDRHTLAQELHNAGLDVDEALASLDDDEARERVLAQSDYWRRQGVSSVPTMIVNHTLTLNGAQPVEVYKNAFISLCL